MSEVEARLGYTVNTGDYESARADFMFRDSVREGETVEQAQLRVYDTVEKELITRLEQLVAEIAEVSKGK